MQDEKFELPYGWAWLLKLQSELLSSKLKELKDSSGDLQPLVDLIIKRYIKLLPCEPVRCGQHQNLAFGLVFAWQYSKLVANFQLQEAIKITVDQCFKKDMMHSLQNEPGPCDFLSPSLQEAELLSLVIEEQSEYIKWLRGFLPELFEQTFWLQPAEVVDRKDWTLVHLEGLNFSRAWNLYNIAKKIYNKGLYVFKKQELKSSEEL